MYSARVRDPSALYQKGHCNECAGAVLGGCGKANVLERRDGAVAFERLCECRHPDVGDLVARKAGWRRREEGEKRGGRKGRKEGKGWWRNVSMCSAYIRDPSV